MAARYIALIAVFLLAGCAPERVIAARPTVDPALKQPCQRPPSNPVTSYAILLSLATDLEIWGECNERKMIDLGKSIDGVK